MRHWTRVLTALVAALPIAAAAQAPASPAPQTPPVQTTPPPAPRVQAPPRPATGGTTLAVEVTDRSGNGIADVTVDTGGPVDREGTTAKDGSVSFRGLRAGTYRLRFEHDDFTTLERELVIRAGQPASVSVALTPAPKTPAPAAPPPPAPVAPPTPKPTRNVEPRTLSIPDFLDTNLIGGGEPQKVTALGCTDAGSARLLQVREPIADQQHADADLMVYVVAGSGVLRIRNQDVKAGPGYYALVPRGVAYGIRRDGRNPVILLTILAGGTCDSK